MAYNEQLADRIRAIVGDEPALSERKMFGGIAFMFEGNMFCGVIRAAVAVYATNRHNTDLLAIGHRAVVSLPQRGKPNTRISI